MWTENDIRTRRQRMTRTPVDTICEDWKRTRESEPRFGDEVVTDLEQNNRNQPNREIWRKWTNDEWPFHRWNQFTKSIKTSFESDTTCNGSSLSLIFNSIQTVAKYEQWGFWQWTNQIAVQIHIDTKQTYLRIKKLFTSIISTRPTANCRTKISEHSSSHQFLLQNAHFLPKFTKHNFKCIR